MATSGDSLRQLFRGYIKRDDGAFKSAAEIIIQEERSKNHRLLADDLERILLGSNENNGERRIVSNNTYNDIPKDRERGFPLLEMAEYDYDWDRLILTTKIVEYLKQITKENYKRDILAANGIKPKQRILFYGPPGCGKTLAAKVMASVLNYPLLTVRFDAIVSSYLGETAANLRRIFEYIQKGQYVVLFDEFDAIGKDRNDSFEHGELKRVVNTLLQLMDAFKGESLLIAATNHEALLDNAVWRRFESVIPFYKPTEQDRILLLRLFFSSFDHSQVDLFELARKIKGATGADIENIVTDSIRYTILDGRTKILKQDLDIALLSFRDRMVLMGELSKKNSNNISNSVIQSQTTDEKE